MSRLERAIEAAQQAYDARGLKVYLCSLRSPDAVRARLWDLAYSLMPGSLHLSWDSKGLPTSDLKAEANTAHNLALLAELLSAHLESEHERREHDMA